jgi:3'(2'), 5'-bisphosphate nucleotidase
MKQFSPRFAEGQSEPNKRLFEDLYGTNVFDEAKFANGYERFVAGVMEYFRGRPGDLLVLNVAAGEGWDRLCPFLGKAVPDMPFPKANVTQIRWMKMEDLVAVAEEAGRALLQRFDGEFAPGVRGDRPSGLRLLDRAAKSVLGRDTTEAAATSAYKVLSGGLRKLNAEMPILAPSKDATPYSERKRWNHVWLVDPLDGKEAFAAGRSDFSINIALIEDGRPIYGVVHAPAKGVTYYGRSGKGVNKRQPDGASVCLAPRPSSPAAVGHAGAGNGGSLSLALCAQLESGVSATITCPPCMEWSVAAAHALITAANLRLCEIGSGAELSYNSMALASSGGVVRP